MVFTNSLDLTFLPILPSALWAHLLLCGAFTVQLTWEFPEETRPGRSQSFCCPGALDTVEWPEGPTQEEGTGGLGPAPAPPGGQVILVNEPRTCREARAPPGIWGPLCRDPLAKVASLGGTLLGEWRVVSGHQNRKPLWGEDESSLSLSPCIVYRLNFSSFHLKTRKIIKFVYACTHT